eukprot:CAMPEP_0114523380 /NCGR_PEP_ID=MMETSP0109-20121206/21258_1 /TAXON_ID=29199 /ORGANISM="Chlorarachnion reptans, Strain CCCM449" /LENGTH=197 /DNA_ID=CAMNT_0001704687 /DNA_START=217 /DNA_END=807 /DNA_ORIENTATION=-
MLQMPIVPSAFYADAVSTAVADDDRFNETTDLLDEENFRSALAYSEEHIQVLVDHQMSTLADRLAALDCELLNGDENDSLGETPDLITAEYFSPRSKSKVDIEPLHSNFDYAKDEKEEYGLNNGSVLLDGLDPEQNLDDANSVNADAFTPYSYDTNFQHENGQHENQEGEGEEEDHMNEIILDETDIGTADAVEHIL